MKKNFTITVKDDIASYWYNVNSRTIKNEFGDEVTVYDITPAFGEPWTVESNYDLHVFCMEVMQEAIRTDSELVMA